MHRNISNEGERVGKDSLSLRYKLPNLLNINELGDFLKTTGTKPGQYEHLPDGDDEDLSGRKKNAIRKTISPPRLYTATPH